MPLGGCENLGHLAGVHSLLPLGGFRVQTQVINQTWHCFYLFKGRSSLLLPVIVVRLDWGEGVSTLFLSVQHTVTDIPLR